MRLPDSYSSASRPLCVSSAATRMQSEEGQSSKWLREKKSRTSTNRRLIGSRLAAENGVVTTRAPGAPRRKMVRCSYRTR